MQQYRSDIDGLRCLAVLGVLLFHLDRDLLPGGYTGVDVFFVISGYLITSITLRERLAGEFSLGRFYQRRVARIMPLSIVVSVSVLIAAGSLYSAQDLASAGAVATAASLFAANLKFVSQGNYFEMSLDAQPLLHYWSLSLEEQFYVVFPFALMAFVRPASSAVRFRRSLFVVAAASLALCIALTYLKPTWAFYLLPTRAWELLAGSLLAVRGVSNPAGKPSGSGAWWGVVGVLGIGLTYVFMHESRDFPGAAALIPVMATLCVLRSGESNNWASRLLGARPLVSVGVVSYSLYLWHWPVFCFVDYRFFELGGWERAGMKLLTLVPLAAASYVWVERPLRRVLGSPSRRVAATVAVVASLLAVAVAGVAVRDQQHPDPSFESVIGGGIVAGRRTPSSLSIVLLGDSKGTVLSKAMSDWAAVHGAEVHLAAVSAKPFVPGSPLYERSLRMVASIRPQIVVVAGAWAFREIDPQAIDRMVADLAGLCDSVIMIGDPPILPEPDYRQWVRSGAALPLRESDAIRAKRTEANAALRSACRTAATFVDVDDLFEHPDGTLRLRLDDGRLVFQDQNHISGAGAELVIERVSPLLLGSRPSSGESQRSADTP